MQKSSLVAVEGTKISDVQCIWGRIFVSLESTFVFKFLSRLYFIKSLCEIDIEKTTTRTFWAHFSGRPYRSNSTKMNLDVALHQKRFPSSVL